MQQGGQRDEQLAGDRVLVPVVGVPPARAVPQAGLGFVPPLQRPDRGGGAGAGIGRLKLHCHDVSPPSVLIKRTSIYPNGPWWYGARPLRRLASDELGGHADQGQAG